METRLWGRVEVEQGQLAQAYVNSANAWWFAQTDALGHRMSHWLQPASNTYTLVQESTDGLRPETVMDALTPYTSGTPGTTIHRDFVLGPDPDEYIAWVDTDGSVRYPMTDREGTVIAQAQAGKAKQISIYDVYGESAAPISEAGPGGAAFPFRYTGQRLDPWTGFLSYKARDYSAGLGRFLQPDPAGVDQGPNLYEYVLDDPVDEGDPSGLCGGHGGNACGGGVLEGIEGVGVESSRLSTGEDSGVAPPVDAQANAGAGGTQSLAAASSHAATGLIGAQDRARANPAFAPIGESTHCNQALCSILASVGRSGPEFVDAQGHALQANQIARNLAASPRFREVRAAEAQRLANGGAVVVFAWYNPNGHGHVGTARQEGLAGDPAARGSGPLLNNIGKTVGVMRESAAFRRSADVRYYTPAQ